MADASWCRTARTPNRRRGREGLSLVETALIISLLGVVAAVALPTFVRTVRLSKITEATEQLAALSAGARAYYATPQPTPAGKRLECLPPSAGPTPAEPSTAPVQVDFGADPAYGASWRSLGFQPAVKLRYRYSFQAQPDGCGPRGPDDRPQVVLRAEGDLDGDGVLSSFQRNLTSRAGELVEEPLLLVRDRVE